MGRGLQQFIGGDGGSRKGASSRFERFRKLSKGKTSKEEIRELEKKLLVPDKLPPYTGKSAEPKTELLDKTVKLVFEKVEHAELFAKHFKVSHYLENSCYELDKLVEWMMQLESEDIDGQEENVGKKSKDNKRKPKVGKRKRRRTRVR